MRAGKQKGALPLIRKFNEHSERLLNSALQVSRLFFSVFRLTSSTEEKVPLLNGGE